jgi:hypothetical protein
VICDIDQPACNFQVLIFTDIDDQIQVALDSNLRSAVLCALLCMKSSQFSAAELYMTITNLSYQGTILNRYLVLNFKYNTMYKSGDFRMIFGEDRNKIRNIVVPNISHFSKLYKPYIDGLLEESADGLLYRVSLGVPRSGQIQGQGRMQDIGKGGSFLCARGKFR